MNHNTSCLTRVKLLRSGSVVLSANCSPNSAKRMTRNNATGNRAKRGHTGASPKEKDQLTNCLWHMIDKIKPDKMVWLVVNLEPIDKITGEVSKDALVTIAKEIDSVKKKLRYILNKHKRWVYNIGVKEKTTMNQGVPAFDVNICMAFESDRISFKERKQVMNAIATDFLRSVGKLIKDIAKFDLDYEHYVSPPYKRNGEYRPFVNYFSTCQQKSNALKSLGKNNTRDLLPGSYSGVSPDLVPHSICEEILLPYSIQEIEGHVHNDMKDRVDIHRTQHYTVMEPDTRDIENRNRPRQIIESLAQVSQ